MCGALEELVNEGVQRGRQEGRIEGLQEGILKGQLEGIHANIRTCKTFKISKSDTIKNVAKRIFTVRGRGKRLRGEILVGIKYNQKCMWSRIYNGSAPILFIAERK
ncbi:MAG: hypothetical protein ACLUTU_17135 [Blautia faecis]